MNKARLTKSTSKRKVPPSKNSEETIDGLPLHHLKLIAGAAVAFGIVAGIVVNWERLFPTAPENLVEMAWTHRCHCVKGWMKALRGDGFVVRDFELKDLDGTRRRWNLPADYRGCHPAKYLGYVLDGHVPAELLRRLANERPEAIGVMQVNNLGSEGEQRSPTEKPRFELIDRDGKRRAWP
ncbi:DUF411 domain-containing protein [Nevskia sp.]|uniref:DUF411 domain-containing protein n=1 Tax=Nevskia sp. TaxID=1929292 RepID=UPI0025EC4563|nr:DUF411 domain-containing protein [Nevskia sp.]